MAYVAELEVKLAHKLASNDKPERRRALKKLRLYIRARSGTHTGFSEEELLKLWKGLFYCVWMQDKPLLQEELSTQISGLLHHFHSFSTQLLFLQTFLITVKREWTGIDRLRMDKYFQLVRFVFRQIFVVLQRSQWEPSCIGRFLELLSSELLQAGAVGLQLHVLDLYLRELAVVGAPELTAEQNLVFIQPFMKTAAKTKDQALFRAICSSIFSTIIDQAPFAIQELLEELGQDSDSGRASEDQEEPEEEQLKIRAEAQKARATEAKGRAQLNGTKAHSEEYEEEEYDEEEGLSDLNWPNDEDVGPVLQFDYGAVADKLLELSSRGNTPSRNRQRLYKIIRVLRDLSQGSFPQDEYPEEVSTDEDDDDFGSRKRMKRKHKEEPEQKKAKGKKALQPSVESNSAGSSEVTKKKNRKKKKSSPSPTESTSELEPQVQSKDQPEPEPEKPSRENNTQRMTPPLKKRKRKAAKKRHSLNKEQQNRPDVEQKTAHSEPKINAAPPETLVTRTHEHRTEEGSKRGSQDPQDTTQRSQKKRKKKGTDISEADAQHQVVTLETQAEDAVQPDHKLQKKTVVTVDTGAEETPLLSESPALRTSVKKRKAVSLKTALQPNPEEDPATRKKIPVEFEYEAEETTGMKNRTPKSDSKKVHFGLKNNRTAEFRRTDRSLLLSPEGPSRVPFDPDQKPKCGVLKSPPIRAPKRKKSVCARPTAADFF